MSSEEVRKNFVLDTSVLVYHEDAVHAFAGHNVFIPITVLEEIDGLKKRLDPVGNAARYVNRFLDDLREKGALEKGVKLENGQVLFIYTKSDLSILPKSFDKTNDNKILSSAKLLSSQIKDIIVISRDVSMRVKANSLGMKAEDYKKEKAKTERKSAYTGVSVLHFDEYELDQFYSEGYIDVGDLDLLPNEFVVLKGGQKSALGVVKHDKITQLVYTKKKDFGVEGIQPRNKEQTFAMEMLMDPDIHMATITGMAGSGKTLLTCAVAISKLFTKEYDKVILSRPIKSMSADIGFLPGSLEEKMAPWVQPFFDNIKVIFGKNTKYIDNWVEDGTIEVESLSYIRGRSLPRTIFILDEAQNITYHEAKAVLTRMGEGSKIILLGDLAQIDAPHLDSTNNGLASVVELFKDFYLSGHITLLKGERSLLASHAAKIL
ncbi:PhoH family protein [bacterium]|nr:PhoH family protein [bacterium]